MTGGLDARGLLSNANYITEKSSSIGKLFGGGGKEIEGLINLALDPTPLSDIFEEEFDFELMRDAMERRLKLALGIDDDSSSKVSGRKDLKEAILGKLSLDKIKRVGSRAMGVVSSSIFEEQIQRMVFRCLSWNPKTHLKNVTKLVDYLHWVLSRIERIRMVHAQDVYLKNLLLRSH